MIPVSFPSGMARGSAAEDRVISCCSVALGALAVFVGTAVDREPDVIEVGLVPRYVARHMADLTVGGKACSLVVRVGGREVIVEVAVNALRRQACIDAARVAVDTVERGVSAQQREGRMVERALSPRDVAGSVAEEAVGWEAGGLVIRIGGRLEIYEMAVDTL